MERIKDGKREEVKRQKPGEEMAEVEVEENDAQITEINEDPRLQGIFSSIRVVPHFPKPGIYLSLSINIFIYQSIYLSMYIYLYDSLTGIMFNDVTTLLLRPQVFKDTVDILAERYRDMGISAVAGTENFILIPYSKLFFLGRA